MGRAAFEANLSAELGALEQRYIGDQKSCHPFARTLWRMRVVPQPRKVCRQGQNGAALVVSESCMIALALLLIALFGISEST
jgi:hypothetical protein